ncbi:VOC family protein [Ligilactobacillus agilis]|uniref:VOC family protein n=1 Tax=Ligilactobacillus agilis TaxID=1601 RepID=UPI003D800B27
MDTKLAGLMQIGIIVRDLDEAVANYEKLGVGPWEISGLDNSKPPFEDLTFDGEKPTTKGLQIKTAMMQAYGMEIELIEPVAEDTPFMRHLKEHGPGLHHLAFNIDGKYQDFINGEKLWIRAQGVHGEMDFSYVDLREKLGLIVECYSKIQGKKAVLDFAKKPEVIE